MNGTRKPEKLGPGDRIAAFARATEAYAESLEDPDLANVYWGKSLGLWQAVAILNAEDQTAQGNRHRAPAPTGHPRRADQMSRSASTRPVVLQAAGASKGW